jgi:hypothetical protein
MAYSGNNSEIYYWGERPDSPWSFGIKVSNYPDCFFNIEDVSLGYLSLHRHNAHIDDVDFPIVAHFNYSDTEQKSLLKLILHQKKDGQDNCDPFASFELYKSDLSSLENAAYDKRLRGNREEGRSILSDFMRFVQGSAVRRGHFFFRCSSVYREPIDGDKELYLFFGGHNHGKTGLSMEFLRDKEYQFFGNSWVHFWMPTTEEERERAGLDDDELGFVFPQMYPAEHCPVRMSKKNYYQFWRGDILQGFRDLDVMRDPPLPIGNDLEIMLKVPSYPGKVKIDPRLKMYALWPRNISSTASGIDLHHKTDTFGSLTQNWLSTFDKLRSVADRFDVPPINIEERRGAILQRTNAVRKVYKLSDQFRRSLIVDGNPMGVSDRVLYYDVAYPLDSRETYSHSLIKNSQPPIEDPERFAYRVADILMERLEKRDNMHELED